MIPGMSRDGLLVAPECHMTILALHSPRDILIETFVLLLLDIPCPKYLLLYPFPSIAVQLFLQSLPPWHLSTQAHPDSLPDATLSTSIERPAFVLDKPKAHPPP